MDISLKTGLALYPSFYLLAIVFLLSFRHYLPALMAPLSLRPSAFAKKNIKHSHSEVESYSAPITVVESNIFGLWPLCCDWKHCDSECITVVYGQYVKADFID